MNDKTANRMAVVFVLWMMILLTGLFGALIYWLVA